MPVIKMMTIIVLVALTAMEEMSEVSSTSFAIEEESIRMTRMILNNNNKSSTKFFMKENNKDEGVSCFDGLYNVPMKEENVLRKKNKINSEIKSQSQRRKSGGEITGQERRILISNMWVHNTFHFTSLHPMASGGSSPLFWRGGDGNYEWRGDARTQLPHKFLKPLRKPSPFLFPREVVIFDHLLEVGGNGRTKEERRREEKRMILTRNNPFDFDGDLKNE